MDKDNKVIITIGREFGSGGHEIGKRLAADLGIAFFDEELLHMAVDKTGYHEEYVKNNEEKAPDFSSGALFSGMDFYQPSPYDKIQAEEHNMIINIADEKSCVIVGRSADYILQEYPHVSVFLFAPVTDRVNRKLALLTPEQAKEITPQMMEKTVKQKDKQRRRFYEYYTDMKWGARNSYDLLINTSRAGINGSVETIKAFIEFGRGENILPD